MHPPPPPFEGSNLGDPVKTDAHHALQCTACGWVYDPEHGDPQWGVPAGTTFAAMPEHWRCPQCEAPRDRFAAIPA